MAKTIGKDASEAAKSAGAPDPSTSNVTKESFLSACREISEMNAKMKALNEGRKAIRKKWKANGIELGVLDATLKMAEWDRDEVRWHFSNRDRYAEWLGLPRGTQVDLFKGDATAQATAEWEARAYTASLAGHSSDPPEECPERFHAAWERGYTKGADELEGVAADPPPAPAKAKAAKAPKAPKAPKADKPAKAAGLKVVKASDARAAARSEPDPALA